MIRARHLVTIGLLVALATPGAALDVTLLKPFGNEAVFGPIEVEAEVFADDASIAEVVLFVDGRARGRLEAPPWRFTVDVGQDNREHRFRVVVRSVDGAEAESMVVTPPIQIDDEVAVELQQLYVTALSRSDERVLDLGETEFRIVDDGERQALVTFARGDVSIAATVLIDSSESMRGDRLDAALSGARAFVEGMRDQDEAKLMLFSDQLLRATPFTSDPAVLLDPLQDVVASGDTSINDHLYLALKLLEARQGRRVVVLFTDGADLNSVLDMDEVLWKARRSQALIYWIRLDEGGGRRSSFATAWRDAEANAQEAEVLEHTVEQSGGRVAVIDNIGAIEGAFRDILAELREQYVLGYYPSTIQNDGSWHEVPRPRVDRPGVRIRARGRLRRLLIRRGSVRAGRPVRSSAPEEHVMSRLAGRRILITGASSGLGAGLARELTRRGARVGLLARRRERLEALAAELDGNAAWAEADVTDDEALVDACDHLADVLGGCDVVIANAGYGEQNPPYRFRPGTDWAMYDTNVGGMIRLFDWALPRFLERREGHLVGVASMASYVGMPAMPAYCGTKAAMRVHLQGLAGPAAPLEHRGDDDLPGLRRDRADGEEQPRRHALPVEGRSRGAPHRRRRRSTARRRALPVADAAAARRPVAAARRLDRPR